ncbi:MAG: histidine--tRNA ligase [Ruminococcus sp.]|jgi:histidyl-tRNA synthetase|nr:histidine--tRNA ligase [Ruminococcus sp.]
MKIKPVNGMKDFLPDECVLRDKMLLNITDIYRKNGFSKISTPAVEEIENLLGSDGGDNLKLIYKILKRGEKLDEAQKTGAELSDLGLRYDLTLPLSRYYLNNQGKLPSPFKCIQADKVYRAERPQKGRMREFMQCDIDILGDPTVNAEIELIAVTAEALRKLDIGAFSVRINHREVLRSIIENCGFLPEDIDSVCITADKMDKIGIDGVKTELTEKGLPEFAIQKFIDILGRKFTEIDELESLTPNKQALSDLKNVIDISRKIADNEYGIEFDLTLVRGQGYYTGIVFEVESKDFGGTVAGGGRYDKMIGKFSGKDVPACGFSIGFERIFSILSGKDRKGSDREKLALLYNPDGMYEAVITARELQEKYNVTLLAAKNKLGKQFGDLKNQGFDCAVLMWKKDEIKNLHED